MRILSTLLLAVLFITPASAFEDMSDAIGPRLADLNQQREGCPVTPAPPVEIIEVPERVTSSTPVEPFTPAQPIAPEAPQPRPVELPPVEPIEVEGRG